jgi:hypothetical protein
VLGHRAGGDAADFTYVPRLTLWLVHLLEEHGMLYISLAKVSTAPDGRLSWSAGIHRRRTGADQYCHTNSDTNQHVSERVPAHLVDLSNLREWNRLTTAILLLQDGDDDGIREHVLENGIGSAAIRAFDPDDAVDANSADARGDCPFMCVWRLRGLLFEGQRRVADA